MGYAPDECIEVFEPVSQLGIMVSISVDVIQRFKEVIHRRAVGKTLEQNLETHQHILVLLTE